MATRYDLVSSYKEWTSSDQFGDEVAEATSFVESEDIEAVYFVSPSIDGRPIGKLVTRELFERVARTRNSDASNGGHRLSRDHLGRFDRVPRRGS